MGNDSNGQKKNDNNIKNAVSYFSFDANHFHCTRFVLKIAFLLTRLSAYNFFMENKNCSAFRQYNKNYFMP